MIAATLGLIALSGWLLGLRRLSSVKLDWFPMAPSTALLFVLLGLALYLSVRLPGSRMVRRTAIGVASAAGAVALLLFLLYWMGIRPQLEYLGLSVSGILYGVKIGHMSPLSAVLFMLCVASFLTSFLVSEPRRARVGFWLACLVIAAGTFFLLAYLFGKPLLYGGSLAPPAIATSLAFVALGIALAALARPRAWPFDREIDSADRYYARFLTLVFALFVVLLVSVGYFYIKDHEAQYREHAEHELSAIAELKTGELARWRAERLGDAQVHFRNSNFADLVRRVLAESRDTRAQQQLRTWLGRVREAYHYDNVVLTDALGVVRMSAGKDAPDAKTIASAVAAARPDQITFLDFFRTSPDGPARLALLVPVLDEHGAGKPLGLLYLEIDPRPYLYPLVQAWPTPSRTAETLLVRRDGDDVLYLNELRFQTHTALSLRVPLKSDVLAAKAVLGQVGTVAGLDYRGIAVIGSLRKVPDSPWFLVARMDLAEALQPAYESLWLVVCLVGGMLLASAAGVGFAWQHRRQRHSKESARAAAALGASVARHRAVTQGVADAIITADAEGAILTWNRAATRIFGYTEAEVLGQTLGKLMPERYRDRHQSGMVRVAGGGEPHALFKTVELQGLTQAGTEFPMELSLSQWETPEGVFFTGIIRDITKQRQAERALRESEEIFRHFMDFSPMHVFFKDEDFRALRLSRNFEAMLGKPLDELLGKSTEELFPANLANSIMAEDKKIMQEGKPGIFEEQFNGRFYLTTKFPINIEGKARYLAGYTLDITDRRLAEESEKQAHEQLRLLTRSINSNHEAEYSHLSRELHDEFGQMLTSLKMDLSWIAARLDEDRAELKRKVVFCMALVDASVDSLHSIAARLRPRILDELGLLAAIDWLVQDFQERTGIDAEFVASAQVQALSQERSTAVFRIVQESLSNIVRHAKAAHVDVSLEGDEGILSLEIRDDGKGLLEQDMASHESIGLLGMRERALAAGGELHIQSVLGKGTVVALHLPFSMEVA